METHNGCKSQTSEEGALIKNEKWWRKMGSRIFLPDVYFTSIQKLRYCVFLKKRKRLIYSAITTWGNIFYPEEGGKTKI
jgi:hypothetical protein